MKFEIFKIAIMIQFCKMSKIEMFLKKRTSVNKNKLGWRDEKRLTFCIAIILRKV